MSLKFTRYMSLLTTAAFINATISPCFASNDYQDTSWLGRAVNWGASWVMPTVDDYDFEPLSESEKWEDRVTEAPSIIPSTSDVLSAARKVTPLVAFAAYTHFSPAEFAASPVTAAAATILCDAILNRATKAHRKLISTLAYLGALDVMIIFAKAADVDIPATLYVHNGLNVETPGFLSKVNLLNFPQDVYISSFLSIGDPISGIVNITNYAQWGPSGTGGYRANATAAVLQASLKGATFIAKTAQTIATDVGLSFTFPGGTYVPARADLSSIWPEIPDNSTGPATAPAARGHFNYWPIVYAGAGLVTAGVLAVAATLKFKSSKRNLEAARTVRKHEVVISEGTELSDVTAAEVATDTARLEGEKKAEVKTSDNNV